MAELEKNHHVTHAWHRVMSALHAEMLQRGVQGAQVVVLVPYAQLMNEAKIAWLRYAGASQITTHFPPRFETTLNWTFGLGGGEAGDDDVRLDCARDALTAHSLLRRAGMDGHQRVLGSRVMEAAWSLARVAAARPPEQRTQWGTSLASELVQGQESPVFAFEAATARIALAWAASSAYPTDVLFSARPSLLVMLEGFQLEPLAHALEASLGGRAVFLPLESSLDDVAPGDLALHPTRDMEDEAHHAAACVLAHLAADRTPVALVAQDRVLTRRVRALLSERGVALRDETGGKLSTTRAAASLMTVLRAVAWGASTDTVLDWLKNSPAVDATAIAALEANLRRNGVRDWQSVSQSEPLVAEITAQRQRMQADRGLVQWLQDLRAALQGAGQWLGLTREPAGQAVLEVLRLQPGAEQEFTTTNLRMSLIEFTAWISQALEDKSFAPAHPQNAQVVILPLSQLLGRALAAVVLPGCDEVRLPTSPEPPGMWTPEQRAVLGLPSRDQLARATRAAWHYALRYAHVDVLWRTSEGGEHVMPSGLVQELLLNHRGRSGVDPSGWRALQPKPSQMPAPRGDVLRLTRLSSSAYEDLRRCPYRFFAMRQLRLQEIEELDQEVNKRDFGNWLHQVLKRFHEALNLSPTAHRPTRSDMIEVACEQATQALALSRSEFLPFAAAWPRVRDGYLDWLGEHESSGAVYREGEAWKESVFGDLTLMGKIDRIDVLADGRPVVIDYKTENRASTAQRVNDVDEDIQLPFYAALLPDDSLAAAYVNVGERDGTRAYAQPQIDELRDQLVAGIVTDMDRIALGAPLPALGEGKACEFCGAKGLCRKEFWESM